jgi:hypothetical protein
MEFFCTVNKAVTPAELQSSMTIESLPTHCNSVYEVMHDNGDHGEINCIWGVFTVHREAIKDGLRFTLPGCPNALAWTVTAENNNSETVVHLTINKQQPDPDFAESIEEFVEDWRAGLR